MNTRMLQAGIALAAILGLHGSLANEPMTQEQAERWLEDFDSEIPPAPQVAEGELHFFAIPPAADIHHLHSQLRIREDSLATGFVALRQCHSHLDAVPAAEISYRYRRMRNLHIESYSHIGHAWVEGQSVQLKDVGHHAALCIGAEVRVLYRDDDGGYVLRNGPFHRRFLDGYFPMRVTLDIHYPAGRLQVTKIEPSPQPGFRATQSQGELRIEAWFAGMLNVAVNFKPVAP